MLPETALAASPSSRRDPLLEAASDGERRRPPAARRPLRIQRLLTMLLLSPVCVVDPETRLRVEEMQRARVDATSTGSPSCTRGAAPKRPTNERVARSRGRLGARRPCRCASSCVSSVVGAACALDGEVHHQLGAERLAELDRAAQPPVGGVSVASAASSRSSGRMPRITCGPRSSASAGLRGERLVVEPSVLGADVDREAAVRPRRSSPRPGSSPG